MKLIAKLKTLETHRKALIVAILLSGFTLMGAVIFKAPRVGDIANPVFIAMCMMAVFRKRIFAIR
jgi:hypothetical protein